MKLVKFSWRNICSYGNKLQEFSLSDSSQLILVEGKNGSGKSSIKEALTVALYGKSAVRKTRDIPNRINKNAYTLSEFITSSGDTVKIERGIDPNFTNLDINGMAHNLPDKRRVDSFLEEELIKLPFSVFSNTISLSFEDFKSFIKLTPTDKRKIIDKIFGTDVLTEMLNKTKEDSRENKKEIEILSIDIENNSEILENSQEQLNLLNQKLNEKKDNEISEKKLKIKTKEKAKGKRSEDLSSTVTLLRDARAKLQGAKEILVKNNAALVEISKKIAIYDKNKCPHCLSDLTDDSHVKIRDAILSKKEIFENKVPNIEKTIKECAKKVKKEEQKSDSYKSAISNLSLEINSLLSNIDELKKDDGEQNKTLEKIIKDIGAKIDHSTEQISKKRKKQNIITEMEELLSDSGIKQALMERIIPVLNAKIVKISKQLEFKFSFEFNNVFDATISHMGEEISPDSLSTGEQKKMNLIVLLSMLELIKMKHHQVNIMFLDEIFSSLDKESIYMTIEILKEFSDLHGLTIFVISHDTLPEELFDEKIMISKNNFFSEMTVSSQK
jgi:exonuclease SbcC